LWFVSNMSKIVRNCHPAPERTELRFSVAAPGVEPKLYRYSILLFDSRCWILDPRCWLLYY